MITLTPCCELPAPAGRLFDELATKHPHLREEHRSDLTRLCRTLFWLDVSREIRHLEGVDCEIHKMRAWIRELSPPLGLDADELLSEHGNQ